MYTTAQVREKCHTARRLKLSGWWLLRDADRAARICNGIGAAWFPWWLRRLLGWCFPRLVLAADIHDLRYELGGSEGERRAADAEFLANGYTIAEAFYPGWRFPLRLAAQWVVRRMYHALRLAGRSAWNENGDGI